jgi:hypothetical protein
MWPKLASLDGVAARLLLFLGFHFPAPVNPAFVYHLKPRDLRGHWLLPLSQLKLVHPDLIGQAIEKYRGRENLMKVKIPLLDCLWNDVVFFSPISPEHLKRALQSAGVPTRPRTWLKIPVSALKNIPAVYLEGRPTSPDDPSKPDLNKISRFDVQKYRELTSVPEWTIQYYRSEVSHGRLPLIFNGIPHVMVKGRVCLDSAQEIYQN